MRIHLSVLPVPLKWIVSETGRRWYQGRFCWSGTYQPGGLCLISLGFGQGWAVTSAQFRLCSRIGKATDICGQPYRSPLTLAPPPSERSIVVSRRNF